LKALRQKLPLLADRVATSQSSEAAASRALATFRRERARQIADRLRLRGRRYEAPQLKDDYKQLDIDKTHVLDDSALGKLGELCGQDNAPEQLASIDADIDVSGLSMLADLLTKAPSAVLDAGLKAHPTMLNWVTEGFHYHSENKVERCLFCENEISNRRFETLKSLLDGGVEVFISEIKGRQADVEVALGSLNALPVPNARSFDGGTVGDAAHLCAALHERRIAVIEMFDAAKKALQLKLNAPTQKVAEPELIKTAKREEVVNEFSRALRVVNEAIATHNRAAEEFASVQENARLAIRKHFAAQGMEEYTGLEAEEQQAEENLRVVKNELEAAQKKETELANLVQKHGPAADAINRVLHSYLGHNELTVVAVNEGYEIHRHGKVITGLPSEGEKTAIAICYFLTSLEAEGKKVQDLVVVIDDPISSLDTRALNFACSLIKGRLSEAGQLFILTHNQQCLNEFRKDWKKKAKPEQGEPTASLLFLDARKLKDAVRSSVICELPKLLREYDSEYHYLFQHVIRFAEKDIGYEYAYMMPNVLRRVLELFLAFRFPGSSGLRSKIDQLCAAHNDLDRDRIVALERLSQVESHSDSLDDLISVSSMTVEESTDAAKAFLEVVEKIDKAHLDGMKRNCA
jgi:wobble nucleotide-excising tRNase